MLKLRKNKGITLVALIITIIILLILAGITIGQLTGNGIFESAKAAKEAHSEGQEKEKIELMLTEYEMEKVENNKELTIFLNEQKSDKKIEDYITNTDTIDISDNGYIITINKENKQIIRISKTLESKPLTILERLNIGDVINYSTDRIYSWKAEYYNSTSDTTNYPDKTLGTGNYADESDKDMTITQWKVLDIDRENNKITLVPKLAQRTQTTDLVELIGAQGYNNLVQLLNQACSSLYGKEGIEARNINMEDIKKYMTQAAKTECETQTNNGFQNGSQYTSEYPKANSWYPSIYAKEDKSVIDGVEKNKENNSNLYLPSEPIEVSNDDFINETDNGAENGKIQASSSIQPYQNFFKLSAEYMRTAFKDYTVNGTTYNYYDLLMPAGTSTRYWIATRNVSVETKSAAFRTPVIYEGRIDTHNFFNSSNNRNAEDSEPLFPILSLSSDMLSYDETTGYSVK